MIIAPNNVTDYAPVSEAKDEPIVTLYDGPRAEKCGLLKMDFLGLRNLTILAKSVDLIEQSTGERGDPYAFPLDDKPTYEMLTRGETVGVFQLESEGMRKALIGMRPDCFEDIIALVALYRPGPMENIPKYCE